MPSPPAWPIGFQTILVRAVLYVLFIGAIAQGAYLEALYLPSVRFSELGFTEITQSLVLATCCAMLIYVRHVLKVWPTVTLLLLAFVAASLVREQDYFLDNYVARHTWKVLVALIVVPSITWVIIHWRRFLEEFTYYSNTFAFGLFTAGLLTTYIFSRLYGRQDFWRAVLEESYVGTFKSAAEEVVELLGYSLILFATLELLLLALRIHKARRTTR
ncbi:hypothetical protein [Halomonas sp. GFAJ-1]|uniref:hypothetical protein n=1 Tax=Halomonas sp. GFAJ-1 TaxID=1118153 RepID=UPI00023A59C6|nr:hypothetical protein [Halomonas sp. GFAJ-1]AVI64139.1 hypothetical protein BB497_16190 [Halomonas sp. GFAJ-1]EHK60159.1 hypothetical protein MOY_12644 [Halomonas sp. GFAJ-1]